MTARRAVTALGLVAWTSVAQAHGEGAIWFMVGVAFAILIIPFAVFLYFWPGSRDSKAVLCFAYVLAFPLGLYAAAFANPSSFWVFLVVSFGIPLSVWLLGALWLRRNATE